MTMMELAESTDAAEMIEPMSVDSIDQKGLAEQLLEQAKEQNIELVGSYTQKLWMRVKRKAAYLPG